ncbi:Receptor of activated protein C kinase 1 [Mortierella sp. 14UC]|nr:Receptor of activated protein C kinase 1 [Mortierella sp. 14UC]
MAKPSLHAIDDSLFPLMEKVQEFLDGDGQVMLILGDSGAGKSTFNRYLEYQLWQDYKPGGPVPLFINLPALRHPDNEMVAEQLKELDFSEREIQELKEQSRQVLLICDGYDESQLSVNLHTTNLLNQPGQWSAKLVITCRTQYLGPDYRDRFVPKMIDNHHVANDLFQEAVIAPFSRSQIETYVERYVPLEPRDWSKADYMDKLATIPNLLDLVKNPFLLTLCLEVLPRVVLVQLYDNCVSEWLGANKRRLQGQELIGDTLRAFEELKETGFEQCGVNFQTELASAIFREQEGKPVVDYIHEHDKKTWKAAFFCPDPEPTLLRDASLLSRAGTHYMFVHRSVLEYFYSCAICPSAANSGEFAPHAYFDFAAMLMSITTHPLSRRNLVAEPSIVHFLSERVLSNPDFKRHLLAIIELSKNDQQASGAAANAITILVRAGVHFNGADLRGIRIPRADASEGQFDSAQFQDSDLSGVNFTKSWIRQANFSNAQMEGALFGELPYLKEADKVTACAYSQDGKKFAVGLDDGTINIYDTASWILIHSEWDSVKALNLAFSPSGAYLLVHDGDMAVRVWNYETGVSDFALGVKSGLASAVAFSSCGRHIVSTGDGGIMALRNAQTGVIFRTMSDTVPKPAWVAFSPDGQHIASAGKYGSVHIFNADTGLRKMVLESVLGDVCCAAYSPDSQWIVSGHARGDLQLWETATGRAGPKWKGHSAGITGVDFSPSGNWIASSSDELLRPWDELVVRLWNARTGAAISVFAGHVGKVTGVVFSPDGLQLASCSIDKTVRLWDMRSIGTGPDPHGSSDPISGLTYSHNGQHLISSAHNGTVHQYDVVTGELGLVVSVGSDQTDCMAFSTDGLRFASAHHLGIVTTRRTVTGAIELVFDAEMHGIKTMAFSSRWVATGGMDKAVKLWDASSGEPGRVLTGHAGAISRLSFSPNGQQIVSFSKDWTIQIWTVDTGELKVLLLDQHDFADVVAFSSDSLVMATSSVDLGKKWLVRLRDADTGDELGPGLEHPDRIACIAFSPCGQWVGTCCGRVVYIWRTGFDIVQLRTKPRLVLDIGEFFGDVSSIAWRLDTDTLEFATGCNDGSIRAWVLKEVSGHWSVQLIWSAGPVVLSVQDAVIKEVQGLGQTSRRLLLQRGAKEDGLPSYPDALVSLDEPGVVEEFDEWLSSDEEEAFDSDDCLSSEDEQEESASDDEAATEEPELDE